jgi:hypothetical protein
MKCVGDPCVLVQTHTLLLMVDWGDAPPWLAVFGAYVAAGAALWQLRLQRIELAAQNRIREREQANQVEVEHQDIDGAQAKVLPEGQGEPVHMIVVINGSKRPIHDVACRISVTDRAHYGRLDIPPDAYGTMPNVVSPSGGADTFVFHDGTVSGPQPMPRSDFLTPGRKRAFAWGFAIEQYPTYGFEVRFTDDVGLHWEIGVSRHLEKLAKRDDW